MAPEELKRGFSLTSHGSRHQLRVAMALVLVVPFLTFCFVAWTFFVPSDIYSGPGQIAAAAMALAVAFGGYVMLRHYPENIVRLRDYLKDIALGELPVKVDLLKSEDDITAIEKYLNMVLDELRAKVTLLEQQLAVSHSMQETIKAQAQEIIEAERQRVMIQSLGAACHHIGQPATVLRAYLDMLKRDAPQAADQEKLTECVHAAEAIAEILDKLRKVSTYRTVPFTAFPDDAAVQDEIIDIGPQPGARQDDEPKGSDAKCHPGA